MSTDTLIAALRDGPYVQDGQTTRATMAQAADTIERLTREIAEAREDVALTTGLLARALAEIERLQNSKLVFGIGGHVSAPLDPDSQAALLKHRSLSGRDSYAMDDGRREHDKALRGENTGKPTALDVGNTGD